MPVEDPTSGRLFVWLVSSFLFITLAAGGSLLLMYVVLPADPSRAWLPVAGIALVCLPWIFWGLTCFYRVISRIFGFRVAVGSGNAGGGGGGGGRDRANAFNTTENAATNNESVNIETPGGDGRQDEFEGPVVMVEQNDSGGNGKTAIKRNLSASNSINNMSFRSHESELPLTSSMAS
ncbi:unnamed protein product [Dovyalis caffra]|uniref:Uncharacterized protein n=1 Tax=Dovyalis caffra TaxID=77055 RepID=A0AAV1SN87_9ROSI|nr:unnamed protein product [Dovyalis caffra]